VREALATPPEGLPAPGEHPQDEDRGTRKPLHFFDRVKFLLLLALIWWILVWSAMANNPLMGISDAMRTEVRTGTWVFVLAALEALRQIHFLISEHSAGYHWFWTHRVFGGFERLTHRRLSNWTRYRLRRLATWVLWIAIVAVVIGKVIHTSPVLALMQAPELLWHALPFVLQLMVILLVVVGQFALIFWFLSRAAWMSTIPTTSRPGSPTSGARTTCWNGSRRTSCTWRTRSGSSPGAATCPAGSCSGDLPAPGRR
jgi:cell division protease FtsH